MLEDPTKTLTLDEVKSSFLVHLDASALVHETGLLRRDLLPDNILIGPNRNTILIDFGAAREKVPTGRRAHSTMQVIKESYSPQDLYLATGDQGPWSGLYSPVPTLYHTAPGHAPPNCQERLAAMASKSPDPVMPLADRFDACSPTFLAAIDIAMSVFAKDRIQSARDWIVAITGATPALAQQPEKLYAAFYPSPVGPLSTAKPETTRKPAGPLVMAARFSRPVQVKEVN